MSSAKFLLEHFYYGQTVRNNQAEGTLRLLASSPDVTKQLVSLAVDRVTVPPLIRSHNGAWALVRGGKQLPFLLVQSQVGSAGQIVSHYILVPPDILRAVSGNIGALRALVQPELPTFAEENQQIKPLQLDQPAPVSVDAQVDDILDLMTVTKNRMDVMEKLLAAIVQVVQIVVQGAPADLTQRVDFIEGILGLLPPSVRFAVTFATHSLPTTEIDAQIRFYSDDAPPKGTLVYNWTTAQITGEIVEDTYSRFMISQLRLDTTAVIEQTRALTPATGWRMKQGDKLADALSYGSYRLKIDEALINNLPVNKDDVSRVLASDPTLNDSQRVAYARHLLKFSLAMNDPQHADPIAPLLAHSLDMERATYQQLTEALSNGQHLIVYRMVRGWLKHTEGPRSEQWMLMAHRAALSHIQDLNTNRDSEKLTAFLEELRAEGAAIQLERTVTKIIERALPLTSQDAALAESVFLLGTRYMDLSTLRALLSMKPFVAQLPLPVRQLWGALNGAEINRPKEGLLLSVAQVFGEAHESVLLVRLAELARTMGRFDLIDTSAFNRLVRTALSPDAPAYRERLLNITVRPDNHDLQALGADGGKAMLQIRLALQDYEELAAQMIQQSSLLYPGEKQIDYIRMVEQLFADTAIPVSEIARALAEINARGIKSAPLMMASIGSLHGRSRSKETDTIARQTEDTLNTQRGLLSVVPPDSLMNLLNYYALSGDAESAARVAQLIPTAASAQDVDGLGVISRMYRIMSQDNATRDVGTQILRLYVREAEDKEARQALVYYSRELGASVRSALEATYALKTMMGGLDVIMYARHIQAAVRFLGDTQAAYMSKNQPTIPDIMTNLNQMPGSYAREDRLIFTRSIMNLARSIVLMTTQKPRNPAALLAGQAEPLGALDVLRIVAGYCNDGRRLETKLLPAPLRYPLGERTRRLMFDEVSQASLVLGEALRAFPAGKPVTLRTADIREEIRSVLDTADDAEAVEARWLLGTELQKLIELVEQIAESGDPKAVEEGSGLAKRIDAGNFRPRSALEFYRLLYTYYYSRA